MKYWGSRYLIGVVLLSMGLVLLLSTTGVIPFGLTWFGDFWPILIMIAGLWGLIVWGWRYIFWTATWILVATAAILSNLGIWSWSIGQLWPAIIILIALGLLLNPRIGLRLRRRFQTEDDSSSTGDAVDPMGRAISYPVGASTSTSSDDSWRRKCLFGAAEDKITSTDFQGGEASVVLGGVDLDLRETELANGVAELKFSILFGRVQIKIPPHWGLSIEEHSAILSEVKNNCAIPGEGEVGGELIITGSTRFGSLEVSN